MDSDNVQKTDSCKRGFYVMFSLILVCNIIIVLLVLNTNSELDKHDKILLTVPPELQSQIVTVFSETANAVKADIAKTSNDTAAQIKVATEKMLLAQESEVRNQLATLNQKLTAIESTITDSSKTLATIAGERESKATAYLKAARAALKTPEVAQILYVSVLSYSVNKAPILSEFIDWQSSLIQQALDANNAALAQDRLMALASICDANISTGSIADMEAIPALKGKLTSIEEQISAYKGKKLAEQQSKLNAIAQQCENVTTYKDTEKLLQELSAMTCDPSLNNQKDSVQTRVIMKQSCLTTAAHSMMLPAINADTPWIAWLENFARRLKSDLSTSKKLEDLGTAADFLQAAEQSSAEGVTEKIAGIESASRQVYLTYWQERVDRALASKTPNLNDISSLLSECNAFQPKEQKANLDRIIKLNKYITQATLAEFTESLKQLKSIENTVADETYVQMAGATQSQYLQLLLRLQGMQAKFPGHFSEEISHVTQKIAFLERLVSSYRNRLVVGDLRKNEAQREKFVTWARQQLELTKQYDDEGEAIARQWTKLRSDNQAVKKYVVAWQTLMSIHPGDLSSADPALFQTYSELKTLIENHWRPDDYQRKRVNYKRISDF